MILKKALREAFSDLEELLDELEAGQATWDEYGSALSHLRAYADAFNSPLSELLYSTVTRLKQAGTGKRIRKARDVIKEATAQMDEIRVVGGRRPEQKRSVRPNL